jgi:hypothetical protein
MSAVMMDSVSWESGEAFDTEADEGYLDGEDYGEDFGEATSSRSRRRQRGAYRPGRGVQGISLRNQDGQVRNVPFPKKLATVEETNRGLASQESARQALDERMQRLEGKYKGQYKRDSAATGAVTLALGLPLVGIGLWQAHNKLGSITLANWASGESSTVGAVTSATQLATTVVKAAMNHRYHHSGVGLAGDIFSVAQLVTYGIGRAQIKPVPMVIADITAPGVAPANFQLGTRLFDQVSSKIFTVVQTNNGPQFAAS